MGTIIFKNVNLFDGEHDQIQNHSWLAVDDRSGRFTEVGSGDEMPKGDQVVDLGGQYVMPGMINCHTHIASNPDHFDGGHGVSEVEVVVNAVKNLRTLLKSGVTYIRECGSTYGIDNELARMQRTGQLTRVPQMMPAGHAMTMTGGHGDYPHGGTRVDSPDEMRKAVRSNFKAGAKCTKVMASGGVMSPGDRMDEPQFTIDELKVAVAETHAKHAVIAAHAEGNPGIMNAIQAGVDSIEHGFYVTDQEIEMMKQKQIALTPTLISAWCVYKYGKDTLPKWEYDKLADAFDDLVTNIKKAYAKGVSITLGTDAGTPYNGFDRTPQEMALMVEQIGFSNFDALTATKRSAQLMHLDDYGTIDANKYADFIVLKANPLADIKAVQQADKQVYQHGQRQY